MKWALQGDQVGSDQQAMWHRPSCQLPLPRAGKGPSPSRRFITHTSLTTQTDLKALWHVPRVIRDDFLSALIMKRLLTKIKLEQLNSILKLTNLKKLISYSPLAHTISNGRKLQGFRS